MKSALKAAEYFITGDATTHLMRIEELTARART